MKKIGKPLEMINAGSFGDMIEKSQRKFEEDLKFVEETGLCHACKKNPVRENDVRCQECVDETERLLKQLRGTPGFMEIKGHGASS
jgi:hypothetical protein